MSLTVKVRQIAPVFTATKWVQLGDHPKVTQPNPIGPGVISTPDGDKFVDIGDYVVEAPNGEIVVVAWHLFQKQFEPVRGDAQSFRRWIGSRKPHPNEGGVDDGKPGETHRETYGEKAYQRLATLPLPE